MKKPTNKKDLKQISVTLPRDLIAALTEMAAAENRTLSNFVATKLMERFGQTQPSD